METDGILHEGEWERVAATKSDEDGKYEFAGLPVADEYGRPYSYRVRMVKPADATYVPLHGGTDRNWDNDYAHLNVLGATTDEAQGTTEVLGTIVARTGGANAYGHAYTVLAGSSWARETGTAVDLGIYRPEDDSEVPWLNRIFPKLGDGLPWMLLVLMMGGLVLAVVARRRKEEQEQELEA